ncbi:MAG: isoleucine--tRNA ligase [Verrucomicrobiota bacterium]
MNYKDSLNLPQTKFPMRANLPKREPALLKAWQQADIYSQLMDERKDAKEFILHDGPPFANGDAHMGHALNMALKDFVLKSRNMFGWNVPFIPGWDCHGLPIEHKVMKELADAAKKKKQEKVELDAVEIRKRSEAMARKFIDIQREQFKRMAVFGEWDKPYITMEPQYEADILRVFAGMVEKGLVYQALRPVYWSTGCQTALAEAEVEYQNRTDQSIFVQFSLKLDEQTEKLGLKASDKASIMIWTTTPWTLPANLGVAAHASLDYVLAEKQDGEKLIFAQSLIDSVASKREGTEFKVLKTFKGQELEGVSYEHPFLDRSGKVHLAEFVTAESGSGLVHIAPGHGQDDYVLGQKVGLETFSPVDDRGCLTEEAGLPDLAGAYVFKANKPIIEILQEKGKLWAAEDYNHSYPHCWRSKTPIVFRSVIQWFIRVEAFRQDALGGIEQVDWVPSWGKNRIRGAVEGRPDWCISRQRTWGVPIPVFYTNKGEPHMDAETIRKVAELVEKHGTNYWFETDDTQLAQEVGLSDPNRNGWKRGLDTLDVWIDSGSSHEAVSRRRLRFPADLYLEGSDQHRGWFQSSLLTSVALGQEPPYKQVVTNGFVVDVDTRKKLSKSSGKPAALMDYVDKFGADILRLWISSQDYRDDVPFSEEIFKRVADTYRSVRNVLRILLANLYDFDPKKDSVCDEDLTEIDRYILVELQGIIKQCHTAYEKYEFHQVYHIINRFCAVELSALYVDVLKDRMYCDAPKSLRRRSSQTAMYEILESLCKLIAPIMPFTAEEAWQFANMGDKPDENELSLVRASVHLEKFPQARAIKVPEDFTERWKYLLELRSRVNEKLEPLRKDKVIGKSLEGQATIKTAKLDSEQDAELLEELCIVSKIKFLQVDSTDSEDVEVAKAEGKKCIRCWKFFDELSGDKEHPEVCCRCLDALSA